MIQVGSELKVFKYFYPSPYIFCRTVFGKQQVPLVSKYSMHYQNFNKLPEKITNRSILIV